MRLPRPAPRASREDNLIPLINVVFLLLIFFLLAGQIGPTEPLAVTPPTLAVAPASPVAPLVLTLAADGRLALAGVPIGRTALAGALAAQDHPATLVLKADAGVAVGLLRETIDALRGAGVAQLRLLTSPVRP